MTTTGQPCKVGSCRGHVTPKSARGLCPRHYQRYLATGNPTGSLRPSAESRFFGKVQLAPAGDCWLWTAAKDKSGYGLFSGRPGGATIRAHIWAYEFMVGSIPAGLELDHLCRKRSCVNPDHLDPVTPRINTLRGESSQAINAVKTRCKRGHHFTPENTYITRTGSRSCRACLAIHRANYDRKKKSA